ncbi:MAG: hypothetical protein H6825_14305 [Planctomycetes bacterium]|nr:hypothetical protein [Planctomycetota bacterium]
MKSSPLSALIMIGVTGLAGTVAWMVWGDRAPIEQQPVLSEVVTPAQPEVMALTPWEQRKKGRLEGAKREIERYKQEGKVLDNGAIKVKDVDGSALYIHPELIEGTGRFGEPLYVMAKYKRRAPVPLREYRGGPKNPANQPKLGVIPKGQNLFTKPEKPESLKALESGGGGDDGQGGKGNKSGTKPGTPKGPPKKGG